MKKQLVITISGADNGLVIRSQGDEQKDNKTFVATTSAEAVKIATEQIQTSLPPDSKPA